MRIEEIDLHVARPFIERWHYSHLVPTGKNIFFGWFDDDTLYAVADYGIGVNGYQASFLSRVTGEEVTSETLLELKRLCRIEPKKEVSITSFIAGCHRILARRGYRHVVSFSDPAHGHNGGVYRAGNFRHLGMTNPEWHTVGSDGIVRHRRYAFRYAQRKGVTIGDARSALGLTRVQQPAKDRWFITIGRRTRSLAKGE